jgi:hypothetical protein
MATVYAGTGVKIARLPGIQPELDKAAAAVLARAKGLAAQHAKSTHYLNSLKSGPTPGKSGVVDREVYSDDPGALAIEFGHLAAGKRGASWVPGQRILLNALYGG